MSKELDFCPNCGTMVERKGSGFHSGQERGEYDTKSLENLIPGEKIMGEFEPSKVIYNQIIKDKLKGSFISVITLGVVGTLSTISAGLGSGEFLIQEVVGLGVFLIISFSVVFVYLYALRRKFSEKYVITNSQVLRLRKGKILMSISLKDMENALILRNMFGRNTGFTVFFPPKGYMDLKEVDVRIPIVRSYLYQLRRNQEANPDNKRLREWMKLAQRVRKVVAARSFPYLNEETATKIGETLRQVNSFS